MTPKEKAKQLTEEYRFIDLSILTSPEIVYKQCALIAVDELIKFGMFVKQPILDKSNKVKPNNSQIEYWKQVKKEIESL